MPIIQFWGLMMLGGVLFLVLITFGEPDSLAGARRSHIFLDTHEYLCFMTFSPDGRQLFWMSGDEVIRGAALNPEGQPPTISTFPVQDQARPICMAFTNDGSLGAAGSLDGGVTLFDSQRRMVRTLKAAQMASVASVAFSPGQDLLATGSEDAIITLWSLPSGKLVSRWRGHRRNVNQVRFSADGRILASSSSDGEVRL